jgi:acetyl esterase/lipase
VPSAEFEGLVEALRANPVIQGADLLEMRANMAAAVANLPLPDDASCEPVDAGGVPSEWIVTPEARDDRVLVHYHGGAYAMGSLATHRGLAVNLSRATRSRVLLPDYRLAPEHPHPAAVEDAAAAYRFVLASGVTPAHVAVSGDSAGGGLAAATLVDLRDAGDALPAAGIFISAWLDLTCSGDSYVERAKQDVMVTRELLEMAAAAYCKGADPRAPTASPLFADLSGLPPLLVQVGTAEVLLDDSRSFAVHAEAAGVDVTLEVAEDMVHVWHTFAAVAPEAREAIERVAAFLEPRWS